MGDISLELDLAAATGDASFLIDSMESSLEDGLPSLSDPEWANLFLTLGSDDTGSLFAMEPPQSTTISLHQPMAQAPWPSSPESGSESSPQCSPQTSPYNDFQFSIPVLAVKDEVTTPPCNSLPNIEPFPPRSPIFDQSMVGNVGVAAPAAGGYGRHLGQPLAQAATQPTKFPIHIDEVDDGTSKKRRHDGAMRSELAAATSGVLLPRDTLLKLSSTEMETYMQTLKASRELTSAEEKQLKKQLRLIKNREYAQESRKKKKSAHQELESELSGLRAQNNELRTHNSALQSEVVLLNSKLAAATSENTRLRSVLRQMHLHQQMHKKSGNKRARPDDDAPSSPLSWFSLGSPQQSPKAVAGGLCLLAVAVFALSFLLQGPGMLTDSPMHDGWSTRREILAQEQTTTYRRVIYTTAPPQSSSSSSSSANTATPPQEQQDDEAANRAKCGHNTLCYLKSHHVKSVANDPSELARLRAVEREAETESSHRQNQTHHAIPIPVY